MFFREASSLSSKMSPMATSSTLVFPCSSWEAASVPRPPQPTSPALSFSGPAPRTMAGVTIVNVVAPAPAPVERLRTDFLEMWLCPLLWPRWLEPRFVPRTELDCRQAPGPLPFHHHHRGLERGKMCTAR